MSGRTLADLILGRDSDLVTMPWVGHRSRRWEPEPIRYLASKAIVRRSGRRPPRGREGRRARRVVAIRPFLPPRH